MPVSSFEKVKNFENNFFFEGDLNEAAGVCFSKDGRCSRALKLAPNNAGQHVEAFLE